METCLGKLKNCVSYRKSWQLPGKYEMKGKFKNFENKRSENSRQRISKFIEALAIWASCTKVAQDKEGIETTVTENLTDVASNNYENKCEANIVSENPRS